MQIIYILYLDYLKNLLHKATASIFKSPIIFVFAFVFFYGFVQDAVSSFAHSYYY